MTVSGGGTLQLNTGSRKIASTAAGGSFTVTANTLTVSQGIGSGLTFGDNVTVKLSIGMDFAPSVSTIGGGTSGTLQINGGGAVNNNAPSYASGSTLQYNSGTTYGRNTEWSATSGAGYPNNVQLSGSTTLNLGNGGTSTARQCAGNLTIDSLSSLDMNVGSMTAALTVAGNASISGTLKLGSGAGGDINVKGNWTLTGTFTPNGRAVFFNGSSAQSITGATTFDYVIMNNSAGLTLNNACTVNQTLTLTSGLINTTGANLLTIAALPATISGGSASSYINGPLARVWSVASSKTFPTGKGGSYRPLTVNMTAVTGTSTVTAEQFEGAGFGGTYANVTPFASRYWTVTESGSSARTYNITLDGTGFTPTGAGVILKYNNPTTLKSATTFSTPNYTSTTGFTSFSDFALGDFVPPAGTTYYSQSSSDPTVLANWNSARDGSGFSPVTFANGDTFVIQGTGNGGTTPHTMTTTATWTVSGTGSKIQIESGGILQANNLVAVPTFQVDNGGTYKHNNGSAGTSNNGLASDIPGSTTRSFGASSTVEIQKWANGGTAPVALPTLSWGNLTINVAAQALGGDWQQSDALATVNGALTIQATGSGTARAFRLSHSAAPSATILGDVVVSGGILDITDPSSGTGGGSINIGGNFNVQSGGTFEDTAGASAGAQTITFTGGANPVNWTFAGTTTTGMNKINWTVASGKTVNLTTSVNLGTTASRTLTVSGTLNCGTSIISGSDGFTLSSGATLGIGDPNGIAKTATLNSGNIQSTGTRSYSAAANYVYTGSVNQDTGDGLPSTVTGNVTIQNTGGSVVNLNATTQSVTVNTPGTFTVATGGNLKFNTFNVKGTGNFTLQSGGTLSCDNANALTLTGSQNGGTAASSGCVRVSGTVSYDNGANYAFLTGCTQTGTGFPATVNNLTFANTALATKLSGNLQVNGTVTVNPSCNLDFNSQTITTPNTPSLGGVLTMEVTRSGANTFTGSKLTQTAGTLTYGGTLAASLLLLSGGPIQQGETIPLFAVSGSGAFANSGGFSSVSGLTQAGLTRTVSQLTGGTGGNISYTCDGSLVANAAVDTTTCSGSPYSLNGSGSGGSGTYSTFAWTATPSGFTSSFANPSVSPTVTTTYHLTVTDSVGCTATKNVVVTVNVPATASTGGNQTICANGSTTSLGGSFGGGASSATWSTAGDGTFSPNTTTLNATYTPGSSDKAAGTVTLTLTRMIRPVRVRRLQPKWW